MRRPLAPVLVLAACVTAFAGPARAGDFMDARLSFALTDENLLVKPGQTSPSIPGLRFGAPIPRWGLMFFDNYDTRFTGFENLTSLVLYKKLETGRTDFEGAFVLRMNEIQDNLAALYDGGSYIKWTYWLDPERKSKSRLSVTAFPMSSDPMRLGYSYRISWGGSPIFFKANPDNPYASSGGAANTSSVPGARVQFSGEKSYAFLGLKTSILLNKKINEQEAVRAVLAGAGVDVTDRLRLEANGGFFDRGSNPKQEVLGAPVQTYGATGQVVYHDGVPVGRSADFSLYVNDPTSVARLFQPEEYPGGLTWLASVEATANQTTLMDPDRTATTMRQLGTAADLNFRLKWNFLRVHADLMMRDLPFLLLNVPGFVPYVGLSPDSSTVTSEKFAAVGADYFLAGPEATLGLTVGLQVPSTFSGQLPKALKGNIPSEALPDRTTVVVRSEGAFDILPPKKDVLPIFAAKVNGVMRRGSFAVLGEVNFSNDPNLTNLTRVGNSVENVYQRTFTNPLLLGFNLAMQARF